MLQLTLIVLRFHLGGLALSPCKASKSPRVTSAEDEERHGRPREIRHAPFDTQCRDWVAEAKKMGGQKWVHACPYSGTLATDKAKFRKMLSVSQINPGHGNACACDAQLCPWVLAWHSIGRALRGTRACRGVGRVRTTNRLPISENHEPITRPWTLNPSQPKPWALGHGTWIPEA